MNEGAKEANEQIKFDRLMEKLDRIIYLLEALTPNTETATPILEEPTAPYYSSNPNDYNYRIVFG